ncbi:MAG: response regulator [Gemmatimonadetes bacterium]|nr:response regulator [Gemmatimonadota bacterium]
MAGWEEITDTAKILLVDDDPVMIKLCTSMLQKAGYQHIWSTQLPMEARELFREIQPDLVLLDMHMAPLNGIAVMKQLRDEIPDGEYVPIVVFTADVSSELRLEALDKGAKDFMTKPVEWGEAMLRIRTRLESRFRFLEMQRTIVDLRQGSGPEPTRGPGVRASWTPSSSGQPSGRAESSTSTASLLLNRLDSIAELIDQDRYADAREKLRGPRWLEDLDVQGIPLPVLKRAQQWIDTGHDALAGPDLDVGLARNALLQVRRVISSS